MRNLESILEKVQKELGNLKCKPGPGREFPDEIGVYYQAGHLTLVQRAVEMLSRRSHILAFMDEFTAYLSSKTGLPPDKARSNAEFLAGYATGYVSDARANKWFETLPAITHPVMGRARPFRKDCLDAGYIITATIPDSKFAVSVMDYLRSSMPAMPLTLLESSEHQARVAVNPREPLTKETSHFTYLVLRGVCWGLGSAIREELGFDPNLSLEAIPLKKE